jgi:hypothetical protein
MTPTRAARTAATAPDRIDALQRRLDAARVALAALLRDQDQLTLPGFIVTRDDTGAIAAKATDAALPPGWHQLTAEDTEA